MYNRKIDGNFCATEEDRKGARGGRAGAPPRSLDLPPVRLTSGLPCYYLTVNFQLLGWLPAMLGFWSSGLPAESFAPVITVAL
jgi:hypothetical protein